MPQVAGGRTVVRGELALAFIAVYNSLTVVLMLHAGFGISTISAVPYTISRVFPVLSLGTWNYLFQTCLVATLMILRRKFVPTYLFSFAVGVVFGVTMDLHEGWVSLLPTGWPFRLLWLVLGLVGMGFGIALSNHCKMPIIPTDLFPRELAQILGLPYRRVKTAFDLTCLAVTLVLSLAVFQDLKGLGIGTVVSALVMGTIVARFSAVIDRHVTFVSCLEPGQGPRWKKK